MTAPRRPGSALLVGLACGAVLVGSFVVTVPVGAAPAAPSVTPAGVSTSAPAAPASAPPAAPGPGPVPLPDGTPVPAVPPPPVVPPPAPPTGPAAPAPPPAAAPPPPADAPPPPARAPEPEPAPRASVDGGAEAQVVALTNDARAEVGCAPVQVDGRITAAAQGHSEDMAANGYFDHDSRDGRGFADRIRDAGYPSPGGENIARGQRDAAEVVRAWLDSPGHRRNIEDCSFTTIGVGLAGADRYWTQNFGR